MRLLAVQKHKACYIGSSNGLFKCPLCTTYTRATAQHLFFPFSILLEHVFPKHFKRHTSTVLAIVASLAPSICFNAMSKQGGPLSYLKKLPVCTQCAKKRKGTKIAFLHILQYPYRSVCEHTILTFIAHKKRLTFEILPVLPLGLGKFTLLKEFQLTQLHCAASYT